MLVHNTLTDLSALMVELILIAKTKNLYTV